MRKITFLSYLILPLFLIAVLTITGNIKWFPDKREEGEQGRRGIYIKKNISKGKGKILIIKR